MTGSVIGCVWGTPLRLGSLCSGVGGLELGVERALGTETVWQAEVDPHASTVLAARWPGVPNLGDLRAADLAEVEPVDVLVAGFPCQPVSTAGRRQGVDDERWLFDDIAAAVGRMDPHPRLLLFENVAGLLSANHGAAMARVIHGLAALGYVGSWRTFRSSDVGAPHRRERVFIAAALADTHGPRAGRNPGAIPRSATPPRRPGTGLRPPRDGSAAPAHPDGERFALGPQHHGQPPSAAEGHHQLNGLDVDGRVRWGAYTAAIRHWEAIHGPAPAPRDDRRRLNPALPEWMLGFESGWVTGLPIPRTAQLRMLGNAVQPQVAELAARLLLLPLLAREHREAG